MARVSSWAGIFGLGGCTVFGLWAPPAAGASQVPLALEWTAPERECPSQDTLLRQVAQLVEQHPSSANAVKAVARVERLTATRYRVLLTTESRGARGSRVLEERSCQALADVVVLILAWTIQPSLSPGEPAQPVAEPPPAPQPPRLAARQLAPRSSASEWQLSLRATGDLGSLPKPALGGLMSVSYRAKQLQLSLQGSYFPQSRGEVPTVAGFSATGGDFSLAGLSLLGCFEPTSARVALCAGPELSYELGQGYGVSSPASGEKSWLSLLGGLRSALHLTGKLWLEAAGEVVVPTLREAFVLDEVGTVHAPSAVGARASLGLGLTL